MTRSNSSILLSFAFLLAGTSWVSGDYPRRTAVVEAFEKNKDAVVNISSKYIVQQQRNPFYNFGFEDFYAPRRRELSSLGSGFVLDPRGYIITNAHVVNHATEITAIFWSDSGEDQADEHDAQLIAIDTENDIALLKINSDAPLTAVKLSTSSDLMIGEPALAIGNPLGYQHTLTEGVVSAIHRNLEFRRGLALNDLIQISTPINPGNSGGPLLNINGQVIGINTAISQTAQGIGFAIPIDQLKQLLPKMLALDSLKHIDFGVQVAGLDQADPNGPEAGALVSNILPGSQAERVGLDVGDRIVAVDGQRVDSALEFALEMLEQDVDSRVKLAITSNEKGKIKQRSVTMTLKKRPQPQGDQLARLLFGLELGLLTQQMIRKYDIPGEPGDLVVLSVEKGAPAYTEGIEVGDILVAVRSQKLVGFDQLGLELEDVLQNQVVSLIFNRMQQHGWSVRILQFEVDLRARTIATTSEPPPESVNL